MKQQSIILILAAVVIVGLAAFLFQGGINLPTSGTQQQVQTTQPAPTGKTVTVEITSSGFNPSSVTINSGDTVKFVNRDSSRHQPASNPHPIHTDYPGFDARRGLATGESYSFTFTRKGTWGFHDHLNPGTTGTIIVQ